MQRLGTIQNQNQLALNAGLLQQYDRAAEGNLNRTLRQQNQLANNLAGLGAMKYGAQLQERGMMEGGANFRSMLGSQNPYSGDGLGSAVSMSM